MALSTTHYHYDTFREELAKAFPGFGHALWEPDPGEDPPVEIGDVGFIREGQFHRLFNALLPEYHESHERFGVPEYHEPLRPIVRNHINRGALSPNTFYSSGVTVLSGGFGVLAATTIGSAGVSFSCTRKQGAVLSLPVTAQREDTVTRDHFREWIAKHIESWFAFTQRLRLGVQMEDIVLVTGCHRTRSWSNITFNEVQADAQFSLEVEVAGALGASVNWRASSLRIQGAVLSQGPSGENLPENQCIFIRGFRMKRILFGTIPRIRGAAEPKPDLREDDSDCEPEKEVVSIPSDTEYRDPLHILLDYIAKLAPDCDMALVHDDDLELILGVGNSTSPENLQPDAVMDYLERSKPEIESVSHSLSANDTTPRTDTEHMTVAMLSAQLKSLGHPSSVSLLPLSSVGTTNSREGSVQGDAPGYPSELAPLAAFSVLDVHGSDGLPRYSQTEHPTPTRLGDEKRAVSLPPSPRSTFQPTYSLGRDASASPLRTTGSQQGVGHDTPPPYSPAHIDLRHTMGQSSAPRLMPQTFPTTKTSYNLPATFDAALKAYKKRTKQNLTAHPLATQLQACDSPEAILTLLQNQTAQFGSSRGGDEQLKTWLGPVVNVLYTFSATLGEGDSPKISPSKVVFTSIGVLLLAAKDVPGSQDILIDIFERVENCFRRLEPSTEVLPTPAITDNMVEITVEALDVFAIATKEIKRNRRKNYLKKIARRTDLEDGLNKLNKLTEEGARMASSEALTVAHIAKEKSIEVGENVRVVNEKGRGVGGQVIDEEVQDAKGEVQVISDHIFNVNKVVQEIVDDGTKALAWAAATQMKSITQLTQQLEMANNTEDVNRAQLRFSLRNWQSPPDPSTNHNIACHRQHAGTATWLFQGFLYIQWKVTGSLLWIHGKPGSGKSVLCSAIINDIAAICKAGIASMAYFYFDMRDSDKQSRRNLLSSLLIQLSSHSDPFCDILSRLYKAHDDGGRQPSDRALTQCLKEMLALPGQAPVYLILDALDECPNTSGFPSARKLVLDLIVDLVDLQLPSLHLCVASRPEADIKTSLGPLTFHSVSLHDQSGQKYDIANYVASVVYSGSNDSNLPMMRWRDADKNLVINVLSERADGMFRWAFCQLNALRSCPPPNIRCALQDLPQSLDETYARVLKEIGGVNWSQARRLFQCLAVASRPLHVEELAELFALDFDGARDGIPSLEENWRWEDQERAILSACSSLIVIVLNDAGSRVVQFAHFSVKEFLTSDRLATHEDVSFFHISLRPAHTTIAQACLGILLQLDNGLNNVKTHSPLADYAVRHWVDHAQFGDVSLFVEDGMRRLFDLSKPHFAAWLQLHDVDNGWDQFRHYSTTEPRGTPLYYASLCGFHYLASHLIAKDPKYVNTRGGLNHSSLVAALHKRHFNIAQLLLRHGAAMDVRGYERQTPLHAASADGLLGVVKWLLDHGADANSVQDGLSTPLNMAAANGHLEVIRMLLGNGVDVDAANDDDHTPLHLASENGHLKTARLLLDHGADVHAKDWSQSTPLHLASFGSSAETVRLLIDFGADVCAQNENRSTPLHLASSGGQTETVRLLIQHGAEVNARDVSHSTPLHLASSAGSAETVRLLIEHGADVDSKDNEGQTPFQVALSGRHPDHKIVARLLSDHRPN